MVLFSRRYAAFAATLALVFVGDGFCRWWPLYDDTAPHVNCSAQRVLPQNGELQRRDPSLQSLSTKMIAVDNELPRYPIPVESMTPLPTGEPHSLPKIQFDFPSEDDIPWKVLRLRESRRDAVKKSFMRGWKAYREKAWTKDKPPHAWIIDELSPISGGFNVHYGGWAATMIDALDTLWIMGEEEEFRSALEHVNKIDFGLFVAAKEGPHKISIFETTIRHLGGLLSAYELSGEPVLLKKAKECGEMLYRAFDTPNHMPNTRWEIPYAPEYHLAERLVSLAEIGTLSMEFTRLSQLTDDPKWFDAIARITEMFRRSQNHTRLRGMWPVNFNATNPDLTTGTAFSLNSGADSMYEYLPKTYALLGGLVPVYKEMYENAMKTAVRNVLYRPMTPENADMLMVGTVNYVNETHFIRRPTMQHLACFSGGMFALGSKLFSNPSHLSIGGKITDTCVWAYKSFPSGIMPETSYLTRCESKQSCHWNEKHYLAHVRIRSHVPDDVDVETYIKQTGLPKGFTAIPDKSYNLRPEAIESAFVMYRVTGKQKWADAAWDMFEAIEAATNTKYGNAALSDVTIKKPEQWDSMESFWFAETLKYLYLIFSEPSLISLDDYVFNTEAHPFKIPKPYSNFSLHPRDLAMTRSGVLNPTADHGPATMNKRSEGA